MAKDEPSNESVIVRHFAKGGLGFGGISSNRIREGRESRQHPSANMEHMYPYYCCFALPPSRRDEGCRAQNVVGCLAANVETWGSAEGE
jgi:hypothetical protein